MKLYQVTRLHEPCGEGTESERATAGWETSDGAASKLCTALKKADRSCEPERAEIDVPTTRKELVLFLNAHAAPAALVGI